MATRVVDAVFRFNGAKRLSTQALQWPRRDCPDPDSDEALDETKVPPAVLQATCEVARKLLEEDWTVDPDGTGLRSLSISGSVRVVFDGRRLRAIVPDFVQALLGRLGQYMGGGQAAVRLVRV